MDSTVRVSAPEAGQASPMYFSTIACGIFALMLGMMVMVGWYTHNPKLVQVHANLYPMQYNTALGFILCGFGLVVSRLGRFLFPRAAGAMAALLGILTLAEYLFGVNLGIDELFMASPMMIESSHAGRMAPNAAAGFVLMGAALMLIAPEFSDRAKSLRRLWIQGTLGMLTMALGGVGVFNALFNIRFSFGLSYWPSMAILTAAGFIILGVGLVAFSWRKGDSHLPIALVLIFGTMLSFTGYFALSNIEEQSSISDFRYESQDRFALFKEKMDSYLDWVRALWAFYESSEAVERDEFYRFTKSCFENAKGRYSLAWIPYLEESKREAFEKRAREEGNPDFKVLEMDAHGNPLVAPGRKEYFPIHYMEPVETQFLPVGFNMASLPPVMKALREARDTGNMVATGRVGFNYRRARQEFFFFAVRPVYSKGVIEDSIAWRRGHLLGFTAGIFRVGDLIEGILGSLRVSQTDILLYDKSASLGERFLYQHRSGEEAVDTVPVPEDHLSRLTGLYYANTVDVAGRKWLFVSLPSAGRFASQSTWLPWAAFFTVLYVSLLLAYYLWGSRQHTVMIENAVKLRTAEWREANEALKYQIEERQKADDKLREMTAAMENAVEGIAQLDGEGKYTYVNKAYAVMTGYQAPELIGERWGRTIEEADLDKAKRAYEEMWAQGKAEVDIRGLHKDGTVSFKQMTMVRSLAGEGGAGGFYCFLKDISERKYKQMIDVKTELITMVSHELRSPLHSVREGISIVLEGLLGEISPEQQDALQTSRRCVDRLVRLVNNVLDFRKLEERIIKFHLEQADLNELAEEVRATLAPVAQSKRVILEVETDPRLPRFEFDKDRITQVILNYADNAVKFTERGRVLIGVSHDEREAVIAVKDTGIGVKPEHMSRLFKQFGQLDTVEHRAQAGSGLGLAISKRIVEEHGGKVWAESECGRGSTFYFSLPLRRPHVVPKEV